MNAMPSDLPPASAAGGPYLGYPADPRPTASGPASVAGRPRTLTLALGAALAVAVTTLLTQLLGLATGRAAVEEELTSQLGDDADLVSGLVTAAVDEAYRTITVRAGIGIFFALVALVLVLLSRGASLVGRILLALTLLVSALLTLVVVADVFPAAGKLVGALALLLTPVAVVLLFLPPVNRYRAARRTAG
ncbi:MAG: hypothetical protein ACKVZ6_15360 [Kineosporiaceae bacterium]|jgi:hypothetical protein